MDTRQAFIDKVLNYYAEHGRHDLPWRLPEADGSFDPYKILVSELMLQQTQVPRVIPKFHDFSRQFPSVKTLASAPLGDVLIAWQGLGYNRRAKFLWQAAQKIVQDFAGVLPNDQAALESLPGVGANTAGAVRAYAFNEPTIFIETNVRTVYIHHFFHDQADVPDNAIRDLLEQTLLELGKRAAPVRPRGEAGSIPAGATGKTEGLSRMFYWALMDYGTYLKQTVGNASRASKHYAKQSKFSGSLRQIRGQVLRLLSGGAMAEAALLAALHDDRAPAVLNDLVNEGLVREQAGRYRLP